MKPTVNGSAGVSLNPALGDVTEMENFRMTFSEDLLNHFVGSLIRNLNDIQRLWFILQDGSFQLNIHGTRYVAYALTARFEVESVTYNPSEQTIKFRQTEATRVRGRFLLGKCLSLLVDDPLRDYLVSFDFISAEGPVYTLTLRRTETMRSFFDTELTGLKLTELFPFETLRIHPGEISFTN
ncbi:MAG: hypothetical protein ABEK50_10890 [bacterium]